MHPCPIHRCMAWQPCAPSAQTDPECSPWDCHSIPTLALQHLTASSLGFCPRVHGAPERSSAPLPCLQLLRSHRELRRADGKGSAAWGWHRAQWAHNRPLRVSWLLPALCRGEGTDSPVRGCGRGDAAAGSRGLFCIPERGPGLLPAPLCGTALWGGHPSPPLEGCSLPWSWAAHAWRSWGWVTSRRRVAAGCPGRWLDPRAPVPSLPLPPSPHTGRAEAVSRCPAALQGICSIGVCSCISKYLVKKI